jgi:glycosyltransferase involved in cell wall biosynthesis
MANYISFAMSCLLIGFWLVRKPDVIYIYNLVTLAPAAYILRCLSGAKVLIDVQDLWPESVLSSGMLRPGMIRGFMSALSTWLYRMADWLTVQSPGFRIALANRGVVADRMNVVYNWCDEDAQRPVEPNATLARELGLAGRFNVLFAGTMGIMQGLDTVLDAAEISRTRTPDVQFVFVGAGVERQRLEAQAHTRNLTNVRFLPLQQPNVMGQLYALADALLVHLKDDPLFRITIPSKTQAYLYMGKPIIMAMQGDAADLVRQANAGVFCPSTDPIALADAVASLVTMPAAQRDRLGTAGAQFYRNNLTLQSGVDHFERCFVSLAQGHEHNIRTPRLPSK